MEMMQKLNEKEERIHRLSNNRNQSNDDELRIQVERLKKNNVVLMNKLNEKEERLSRLS